MALTRASNSGETLREYIFRTVNPPPFRVDEWSKYFRQLLQFLKIVWRWGLVLIRGTVKAGSTLARNGLARPLANGRIYYYHLVHSFYTPLAWGSRPDHSIFLGSPAQLFPAGCLSTPPF